MNKRNFVTGFQPDKAEFDALQDDLENGINFTAAAVAGMGIREGFETTISGNNLTVTAGKGFDGLGRPLESEEILTRDLGTISRPGSGSYKWITIALKYRVKEEGTVIDISNKTWPFLLLDSLEITVLEGATAALADITKPSYEEYEVPLLDIRVDSTTPWDSLLTETVRKPVLIPIAEASSQLETHKNNTANPHGVTKSQVGLGLLPNAKSDSISLNSSDSLATSKAAKAAYDKGVSAQSNLDSHSGNTSNPHGVTKNQVGLGSLPNAKSDSISLNSSDSLATSKAAKIAYDKGASAQSNLDNHTGNKSNPHAVTRTQLGVASSQIAAEVNTSLKGGSICPFPVGAYKIQFPGEAAPGSLWSGTTWSAQFDNEGIFFRTPGGYASSFNGGIQMDAMQRITGSMAGVTVVPTEAVGTGVFSYSANNQGSPLGESMRSGTMSFDSAGSESPQTAKTNNYETRVKNRTIRVWKRTA